MDSLEKDSIILARAMMYRSRQRRKASQPTTPEASASESDLLSPTPLMEYVGRGILERQESQPESGELGGDECGPLSFPTVVSQDSEPSLGQEQTVTDVVHFLEEIGEEYDQQMQSGIIEALASPSALQEMVSALTYSTYRQLVEPFVSLRQSSDASAEEVRRKLANLFCFSDQFLAKAERDMGGIVDVLLEQKLEDYNKQVMLELLGHSLRRLNGFRKVFTKQPQDEPTPDTPREQNGAVGQLSSEQEGTPSNAGSAV